jgi:ADP-ribose pyrophosphatase YjhB (NUDIX family)
MSQKPYVPTDVPPVHPVSVKGVVIDGDDRVLLLKNGCGEWELPGGRLEVGEHPKFRVAREICEETGWMVTAGPLLDVWVYEPTPGHHVLIVAYGCSTPDTDLPPALSHEHREIGQFTADEVPDLNMPQGYKDAVATWYTQSTAARAEAARAAAER